MDTVPRPDDDVPDPRPGSEGERGARLAWEAEGIAHARASVAAGYFVTAAEVDTWIVAKNAILFVTAVRMPAISVERWMVVGNRPLELELQGDTKFFRKNPSGHGFLIYVSKPEPSRAYEEHEASAEECRGLEPLLVWEPDQIEQRVEDIFQRRDNPHLSYYLQQLTDRRSLH